MVQYAGRFYVTVQQSSDDMSPLVPGQRVLDVASHITGLLVHTHTVHQAVTWQTIHNAVEQAYGESNGRIRFLQEASCIVSMAAHA